MKKFLVVFLMAFLLFLAGCGGVPEPASVSAAPVTQSAPEPRVVPVPQPAPEPVPEPEPVSEPQIAPETEPQPVPQPVIHEPEPLPPAQIPPAAVLIPQPVTPQPAPVPPVNEIVIRGSTNYRTVRGDTISSIAARVYGRENMFYFPLIRLANMTILNPDVILPGVYIIIPDLQANLENETARNTLKAEMLSMSAHFERRNQPRAAAELRSLANKL